MADFSVSGNSYSGHRLNTPQAAQFLGVTKRKLKALRKSRRLAFHRLGHRTVTYSLSDLQRLLDRTRVKALGGGFDE